MNLSFGRKWKKLTIKVEGQGIVAEILPMRNSGALVNPMPDVAPVADRHCAGLVGNGREHRSALRHNPKSLQ